LNRFDLRGCRAQHGLAMVGMPGMRASCPPPRLSAGIVRSAISILDVSHDSLILPAGKAEPDDRGGSAAVQLSTGGATLDERPARLQRH
jgi:hypothetical protein